MPPQSQPQNLFSGMDDKIRETVKQTIKGVISEEKVKLQQLEKLIFSSQGPPPIPKIGSTISTPITVGSSTATLQKVEEPETIPQTVERKSQETQSTLSPDKEERIEKMISSGKTSLKQLQGAGISKKDYEEFQKSKRN